MMIGDHNHRDADHSDDCDDDDDDDDVDDDDGGGGDGDGDDGDDGDDEERQELNEQVLTESMSFFCSTLPASLATSFREKTCTLW